MTMFSHASALFQRLRRDDSGASAVEFAILFTPFVFLILALIQLGLLYSTQSALNIGVVKTAEFLRDKFVTGGSGVTVSAATLKSGVATGAGALIFNDTSLSVEIRQFTTLAAATIPITDGITDYGTNTSTLALRAKAQAIVILPGLGNLNTVTSSALIRRQGS